MIPKDLFEGMPIVSTGIEHVGQIKSLQCVPVRFIWVGELAAALGTSRTTLLRWIDEGRVPKPARAPAGPDGTPGTTHRRWPIETAVQIVRDAGREVPALWL